MNINMPTTEDLTYGSGLGAQELIDVSRSINEDLGSDFANGRLEIIAKEIEALTMMQRERVGKVFRTTAADAVYRQQTGIQNNYNAPSTEEDRLLCTLEEIEENITNGIDIRKIWGIDFEKMYEFFMDPANSNVLTTFAAFQGESNRRNPILFNSQEEAKKKETATMNVLGDMVQRAIAGMYRPPSISFKSPEDQGIFECLDPSELTLREQLATNERTRRIIFQQKKLVDLLKKRPRTTLDEHLVTDDEREIFKSNDLDFLQTVVSQTKSDNETNSRRKRLALVKINLLHKAYLVATRYSVKYCQEMTDEVVRRFAMDGSNFRYVPGRTTVKGKVIDSYFEIITISGAKLYIAEPKSIESVMRKVISKGVTSLDFDEIVRDQVRMTVTLPPEYYEGTIAERRARMARVDTRLNELMGLDTIPEKTRDYLEPKKRDANVNSNADRVSHQATFIMKGANYLKRMHSLDGNENEFTDAAALKDIPVERQILPNTQFVLDPEDPYYVECKIERHVYETKSWFQSADSSGLETKNDEYFMRIVKKALDLGTYNGCNDPRVVKETLEVAKAYNTPFNVFDNADDPNTITYMSLLTMLAGNEGEYLANILKQGSNIVTNARLIVALGTIRRFVMNKELLEVLHTAINRLSTPQPIPVHS